MIEDYDAVNSETFEADVPDEEWDFECSHLDEEKNDDAVTDFGKDDAHMAEMLEQTVNHLIEDDDEIGRPKVNGTNGNRKWVMSTSDHETYAVIDFKNGVKVILEL
ncbi:unnamed protein product [Soboliphyme baturini]|uniref:DUF4258 domain-containing protein n=1 Tax=Soboliphyme baturini TaxID=241478 RepID=A0A183IQK0_9BILA|nr:unnamed protein product [Soboliphyme baturini]